MLSLRPINRTQGLLLGFFAFSFAALVIVLVVAPDLYDRQLEPIGLARLPLIRPLLVVGVAALVAVLSIGVLRRWRWTFWLVLIVFAAGVLRLPVFGLQLTGAIPLDVPLWYAGLQAVVGVVQILIAAAMLIGYRRDGPWGAF